MMNSIGKKYPRIYSASTVGIRNHNNADFLIHPLRTDFTGQSGTGKSLIGADLPQLILTAGRFYKSATKPKGDVSRDYNSIPLSTKDFGYAFMNVEWQQGKFIVIGVMIRKAPKQLHPFIIQANIGIHPENNSKFKPLEKIIRYQDFIVNGEILSLDNLKNHFDDQNIYLTSYYRNIPSYHKLLNTNKILHLDLSADENLQRQYAHTLQSLSRGEDIDTSGIKFKRFLFHYDDEVAEKFKNQSKVIEDDHRKYQEDWKAQNSLSRKKDSMINLVSLKKLKVEAYEKRLSKETIFYFQQKQLKEVELKKTTEQYFQTELEIITLNQRKNEIELASTLKETDNLLRKFRDEKKLYKEAKSMILAIDKELETLDAFVLDLEKKYKDFSEKNDKIIQVENWLKGYTTVENIKLKFETQNKVLIQKEKLNSLYSFLKVKKLEERFKESEYSKSFKPAIEYYSKRRSEIELEVKNIDKLKEIILKQNPETFAGWAVSEEIRLDELQESVLFHFATAPKEFSQNLNYIPEPKKFIDAIKNDVRKTEKGFAINLSGLYYHIDKRPFYIFGNPKKLKTEVERIGKNYQNEIDKLSIELNTINQLDNLFLSGLNYSEEHLSAYLEAEIIQSFVEDETLNLTKVQIEERISLYHYDSKQSEEKKVKRLYSNSLQNYSTKLATQSTSKEKRSSNETIQTNSLNRAKEMRNNFKKKIDSIILIKQEKNGLASKLISWQSQISIEFKDRHELLVNPYKKNKQNIIQRFTIKYKTEENSEKLSDGDLREIKGELKSKIEEAKKVIPRYTKSYENKILEFNKYFKIEFDSDSITEIITDEILNGVNGIKTHETSTKTAYENKYDEAIELFNDDLQDNPKIKNHQHDLNTLILELIPHEIISNKENPEESLETDIEDKLARLHQQIKELNKEEAKKIHSTVRDLKRIVEQQTTFLDLVKALLKDFRLATYHKVLLNWSYSTDYNLKWIESLNKDIENLNFTDNLFGEKSKISAQELLEMTFKKYCPSKIDAKANEILNPFNYYKASAIITDPNDNPSPGSSGQNYGMLALLCIAKLSIVEGRTKNIFNKIEPGIRILPIDEVAGLGENFDMLYEIAQKLDYQIFTMTIAANDLSFDNGKQIYYELIKNSDEKMHEYNEGVQACFSKDDLISDIETHFTDSVFSLKTTNE